MMVALPSEEPTNASAADYGRNWSKNIRFHAEKLLFPTSTEEVVEIVRNPNYTSLKAFGSRHCFNNIADTATPCADADTMGTRVHIGTEKMTRIHVFPATDKDPPSVRFEAGVTFTQLVQAVLEAGYALANMPSLPHISVVGGILTGTHGSGIRNGIIAKSVLELKIVHPSGELVTYSRKSWKDPFWIHLGALGVVVSATMELEADYRVAKGIYLDLPYQEFLDNIEGIMGPTQEAEFVSAFMDWKDPKINSTWIGKKYYNEEDRPTIPDTFFGAKHIPGNQYHPVPLQDPEACITTGYGSWRDKLNHFLPDHPPSSAGNEIQAEFFVPFSKFRAALEALWEIKDVFARYSSSDH